MYLIAICVIKLFCNSQNMCFIRNKHCTLFFWLLFKEEFIKIKAYILIIVIASCGIHTYLQICRIILKHIPHFLQRNNPHFIKINAQIFFLLKYLFISHVIYKFILIITFISKYLEP